MSSFEHQFLIDFEKLQNELNVTNPCKSLYIYNPARAGPVPDKDISKMWGIGINLEQASATPDIIK